MGAQPADGGFAVLDLGGKGRVLAEAIIDRGDRVALGEVFRGNTHFLAAHA
jgi:hypothetical protein